MPKAVKNKNTIIALDGVRAFACLSVVAYHINHLTQGNHIWSEHDVGPIISSLALAGSYGVTLFFILSGFLLFMPYARSLLFDAPWPSLQRYYVHRIFRIWPGYYVSLGLLILFLHREYLDPDHWRRLFLFLTFFMDAGPGAYQFINGPFWTLAVEWQFYLLLPVLALGLRWIVQRGSLQRRLTIVWLGLLGLIVWGLATRHWGHSWQIHPAQKMLLPVPLHRAALFLFYGQTGKFLEDFAVGMLVCVIYVLAQQEPSHTLSWMCQRYSRWIWMSGVLWLMFAATWSASPELNWLQPYLGAHNWLAEMPYALGFGFCVLALLFSPSDLRAFFEWKPMRWLGQRSYGMYIWHLPFTFLFSSYLVPFFPTHNAYVVYGSYWLCILCVVIPFCSHFYYLVEQPWIRLGAWATDHILPIHIQRCKTCGKKGTAALFSTEGKEI